jgi:hypothetical protein
MFLSGISAQVDDLKATGFAGCEKTLEGMHKVSGNARRARKRRGVRESTKCGGGTKCHDATSVVPINASCPIFGFIENCIRNVRAGAP